MFRFEYTIDVNKEGRPILKLTEPTNKEAHLVEHKFMGIEITRSIIEQSLAMHENDPEKYPLPKHEYDELCTTLKSIERLSDVFAFALHEQMIVMNEATSILNPRQFDVQVDTINDLHNLNYNGIIFGDHLFKREEGFRVMVVENKRIYELRNGIDNGNWIDTTGE